ncbi:MAG: acyltransferase family protein [Methyloprofundus sp.]|nr:acyltransferase family protein [Methyloprofundus sp.]
MSFKTKEPSSYIDQLTWLRGAAAFFVIVSHTIRATEVKYSLNDEISSFFLLSLFDLGSFGVVLFFALSGCTLYISNWDKVGYKDLPLFYIKRFFRIWPAFVVSLAVYIGFGFIFSALYVDPQGHWVEKQFLSQYSIYDIFSYLSFTFNITGPAGLFNNAYWSLPVEFQYYIIFPIIVASLRYGIVGPIVLGAVLYLLPNFIAYSFSAKSVFTLAFSFCGGVLVGYVYKETELRIKPWLGVILFIALLSSVIAIAHSYITLPDIPVVSGKSNWYGGIAVITVLVVLLTKINFSHRTEKFLKHYGTISYSTYLYHNLFIAIAVLFIIRFEIYDSSLRLLITFFFTLITSYLFATVSYRYIEKPSIEFCRSLIKKQSKKK